MRHKIITCLLAAGALLGANLAQPVEARGGDGHEHDDDHEHDRHHRRGDRVFAEGGVMAGSTNGISFAPDGTLWVANVLGQTITQIDPDSGEILSRLTAADGVFFPDDVVVGPDSSIYWTDIGLGTVFRRLPDGTTFPLILPIPGGLNSANPLTLSDDGSRLWAAGCYGAPPANNSFVEVDPNGVNGIIKVLREDVPGCASNGMSWHDGHLYAPQPFTDEILRIDPDSDPTDIQVVTSGFKVPIGTAFDSEGHLYSLAQGVGQVVRVDLGNTDTENNRTIIADIPVGWADNIAISADDRIFISSASDSAIVEVLPGKVLRTVVPGQFELPLGVAVIGKTLYTANIGGLWGFDRRTGDRTSVLRAAFGLTEFPSATSVVAWGKRLVLMSALDGRIMVWNPKKNVPVAVGQLFPPTDAQPFRGDLIVTQGNGEIVRLSKDLVPVGVIGNVPGATGLARRGGSVYVADSVNGTVLQIIKRGEVLAAPVVVVDGLSAPEGIDIKGRMMYVVEGGTQSLTRIDLKSGKRKTIATDLGFQDPSPLSATGWFNNVTVAGNDIYVNADRANVIYEFHVRTGHHRHH
jgi:sugar lactone lactonase YvrE